MKDIRRRLLETFQVEHRDHVEQIRSLLAMIGTTSKSPSGAELDEVFRRAHSLKGAARAVDVRPVETLAHRLETLFSRVRQGELALDDHNSRVVRQTLDAIEDSVAGLSDSQPAQGFAPALSAIEAVLGMESEATAERAADASASPSPVPVQPRATVRVTSENFDGLLQSAARLVIESRRQSQLTVHLDAMATQIAILRKETDRARRACSSRGESPRAAQAFVDSVEGETRSLARRTDALRRWQRQSARTLSRLAWQLQSDVRQARMIPADSLFDGYRKMMRDLARDESKEIEFQTSGSGVQADRGVLEMLKDPLMHVLRNAVSHGIENPKDRICGKAAAGLVSLRIASEGQRLVVTIEDDGRGVDFRRVAEVAVRQGILSESEAANWSEEELARVVFRPGFSTSRVVTSLAGRGMGLSVVYETVRKLQGDVDVRPHKNGGTVLSLSVPLSISSHRLLLLRCNGQRYGIPVSSVERLYRIKVSHVETVEGKPVVAIDDRRIPFFTVHGLLGLDVPPKLSERETLPIMIVRSGTKRFAVAAEAFLEESEAVIQDLGPATPRNGRFSGGILLDDGSIALVVNPGELFTSSSDGLPAFLKSAKTPGEKTPASILVVDDSITTRTLERSILEAHGFRVRVAVDGMDGLAQLRSEKADLVIADVQMPRLDGFGLLEAIKKDEALQHIPVIVVTSLERREDQERGMALGADAYVVKRKFDQEELLATIRQIL